MAEFEKTVRQWARMCEVTQRENEAAGYSDCSGCKLSDICCGLMPMKILEVATVEEVVMPWAAEHPEPVYPSWYAWLANMGIVPIELPPDQAIFATDIGLLKKILADIAHKLGIEPKEDA